MVTGRQCHQLLTGLEKVEFKRGLSLTKLTASLIVSRYLCFLFWKEMVCNENNTGVVERCLPGVTWPVTS